MAHALPVQAWLQDGAALVTVIALVLLTGYAARRGAAAAALPPGSGLLRLRARLALDARRRLHLVETPCGAVLVLTGGGQDLLVTLRPEQPEPRAG